MIGILLTVHSPPIEPPPSKWTFPSASVADRRGLVCAGGDLEAGTVLHAYRRGLFPMPLAPDGTVGWWSPDPRGILPLDGLRTSRSLRRSMRRYGIGVDTAFDDVVEACADPRREHGWIDDQMRRAYADLHRLGWAHSVEAWDGGELVGGLYGIAIGGFFAGESMFHRATDASKVALVALVDSLRTTGAALLDVQWQTEHLATLGAIEVPRPAYLQRLREALVRPLAGPWAAPVLTDSDRPRGAERVTSPSTRRND